MTIKVPFDTFASYARPDCQPALIVDLLAHLKTRYKKLSAKSRASPTGTVPHSVGWLDGRMAVQGELSSALILMIIILIDSRSSSLSVYFFCFFCIRIVVGLLTKSRGCVPPFARHRVQQEGRKIAVVALDEWWPACETHNPHLNDTNPR